MIQPGRFVSSAVVIAAALVVAIPTFAQSSGSAQMAAVQAATPVATQAATPAATAVPNIFTTTINLGSSKSFPAILVGPNGLTLYTFTEDTLNQSTCFDACAKAWPPLIVASADQLTVASGIVGTFATITRKDGSLQVTDNGQPLYYWFKDKQPGDTTGNRIARTWWVVPPAAVAIYHDSKLGSILVGPTGMTAYTFSKDTAGVSNCTGGCLKAWPPLTVKSAADLIPGANVPGVLATITRADDGLLQVTYNGLPLYYFSKDKAIGDTTGEAVGNTWYTIVPETVISRTDPTLGSLLISYDGLTLYTYSADQSGVSTCTADCLKSWTPFTIGSADRLTAGVGITGKLASFARADTKALQVTYNGAPLYFSKSDKAPGTAAGQGADNNAWNVVKP